MLTTFLALLYVLLSTPKFRIDGSLFMGDASSDLSAASTNDSLAFLNDFDTQSDVETDVELLQGKSLVEQAILETGMNAPVTAAGAPHLTYLTWRFFHGHAVQAYAPAPGDLEALYAMSYVPTKEPRQFRIVIGGGNTYKIEQTDGMFGGNDVLSGTLGQPAAGGGLSLLLTPALAGSAPAAGSVFTMQVLPAEAVYESLQKREELTISPGGTLSAPTKVVNLQLLYTDPYVGQRFVNQLMSDFIAKRLSWKTQSASATEDFISGQLKTIHGELLAADESLASYQSQTGILDVPENAKAIIGELSQYETQRTDLELQQEALQQLKKDMAAGNGSISPFLVGEANDPVLGQLSTNLAAAEAQLQALNVQYTGNTTEMEVQEATVRNIEDSMRSLVADDLKLAASNLQAMDTAIDRFNSQLRNTPDEFLKVTALSRDTEVYGQLYVLLMQKAEEAAVSKAATIINTRVVVPAELPLDADEPRAATTILAGFLIGSVGGLASLLWRQSISGRFETDDEIRRDVPLPVYGLIPLRGRYDGRREVVASHSDGPFAEGFRFLRGNLAETAREGSGAVILVTSAQSGDGKTIVAANLAKCLSDAGKKVLLVDADMRIGPAGKMLKAPVDGGGLSEWLRLGRAPALVRLPGGNFAYLPAGPIPERPTELLDTKQLGEVLSALRQQFEVIILDSPPLPAVSDGMILAAHADLVLSVLRLGHSGRRAVWHHLDALARLKKPQALVINGMVGQIFGYGYGPNASAARLFFPRRQAS